MSRQASQFPWERLKAETLRTVCKELGLSHTRPSRAQDMLALIKEVEKGGLEPVMQQYKAASQQESRPIIVNERKRRSERQDTRALKKPSHAQEHLAQPRRSGREPRMSTRRRESIQSATATAPRRPARPHRPSTVGLATLAAKKAQFAGVEMPALRMVQNAADGRKVLDSINSQPRRTFAQIEADIDEGKALATPEAIDIEGVS